MASEIKYQNNVKVVTFKAPEGDLREIVLGKMFEMANIEWTPKVDTAVGWKKPGDFGVNLTYKAGVKYRGVIYSGTRCGIDAFKLCLDENNVFEFPSHYFEEIVGNHCSSSMGIAFQEIVDAPYYGGIKPLNKAYPDIFKFPVDSIKAPYDVFGPRYDSVDVFKYNSKANIFEGYAALKPADILYFSKKTGSGHTRMVSKESVVVRNPDGSIDGAQSKATVIEQTNAWDKTRTDGVNTTWFVNREYTFDLLYEKLFMPVTLSIYTNGAKPKDAFMIFESGNDASSVKDGLKGNIRTTLPLNYALATITNAKGECVKKGFIYNLENCYEIDLTSFNEKLGTEPLEKGEYTYKLIAAISRGTAELEEIKFTV